MSTWAAVLVVGACVTGPRSDSGTGPEAPSPCARLRGASANVEDVTAGVALSLRVAGSELDVIALQDYVGHLVDAWNEAERGIVQRCFPRVTTSSGTQLLASTAELALLLDGARIVFKPVDPAQLTSLRNYVHRQKSNTLACACDQPEKRPRSTVKLAPSRATCRAPSAPRNHSESSVLDRRRRLSWRSA